MQPDTNNSKSTNTDLKMKELKHKNAKLVAIAKKLEEKVKTIQNDYDSYVGIADLMIK